MQRLSLLAMWALQLLDVPCRTSACADDVCLDVDTASQSEVNFMQMEPAFLHLGSSAAARRSKDRFLMTWNAYGTEDRNVTSAKTSEECFSACDAWDNCKVGVWDHNADACRLAGGTVSMALPEPGSNVTGCMVRANPELVPEYDCTAEGANCGQRLGAVHWNPCYSLDSSLPSLIDGARAAATTGTRVIKVALFQPAHNYPYNSPEWPTSYGYYSMRDLAMHPYYRQLWESNDFDTYVLVAYSKNYTQPDRSDSYWREVWTPEDALHEQQEFESTAAFFLREYPQKTFVFENWEGDWSIRWSTEDWDPAPEEMFPRMVEWVEARQAGVTSAREKFKEPDAVGNVYMSLEVNLVINALRLDKPNLMNRVVPNVATDMISYSAYDSQYNVEDFRASLEYISRTHVRTPASPPGAKAIFIAEYGVPLKQVSQDVAEKTIGNVVNAALDFGVSYVIYWNTYDNECISGKGCEAGRCASAEQGENFAEKDLRGWWLVSPSGEKSWSHSFLKTKIGASKHSRPSIF